MKCDPVAGYVQIPCVERCALWRGKGVDGRLQDSEEVPENRRVDPDTTSAAMALRPKKLETNSKCKET